MAREREAALQRVFAVELAKLPGVLDAHVQDCGPTVQGYVTTGAGSRYFTAPWVGGAIAPTVRRALSEAGL